TEGAYAQAGAGNEVEAFGSFRYGGTVGDDLAWRAYVEHTEFDGVVTSSGADAGDDWQRSQAGFRLDSILSPTDTLTVQGDVQDVEEYGTLRTEFDLGTLPEEYRGKIDVGGHNLLGRWERRREDGAGYRLQVWF